MMNAYREGKDLYATIATGIYHNTYWDNMEHYEDGSPNPAGKKRRGSVKALMLGIMYGMGSASLAEAIGGTTKDAQKIIDDFYAGFPKVKKWMDKTDADAKKYGYVEDFWGRRRRLPDIQLPKFQVFEKGKSTNSVDINPLLGSKGLYTKTQNPLLEKYLKQINEARGWQQARKIKEEALTNNIEIRDNGAFIAYAERQCVNARVQGGAATMSKIAMRRVYDNEELRKLGFRMLLQVHDELIGECPVENADKVAELLSDIMKHSAEPVVTVPFKCDTEISQRWYYDDFSNTLRAEFDSYIKEGMLPNDVYNKLLKEHTECTKEQLEDFLGDKMSLIV